MSFSWDQLTKNNASTGPMNEPAASVPDLRATIAQIQIPPDIRKRLEAEKFPVNNDGVLLLWQQSKKIIQEATAFEMEMRKLSASLLVSPDTKKEGVNNVELGGGYVAKVGIKYNYILKSDKENVDKIDAVDAVIDDFVKMDNEGSFIAERLFTWEVKLSVAEYRLLEEAAKTSATKKAMFDRLLNVLEIKEAAPTLEIRDPKVKK